MKGNQIPESLHDHSLTFAKEVLGPAVLDLLPVE